MVPTKCRRLFLRGQYILKKEVKNMILFVGIVFIVIVVAVVVSAVTSVISAVAAEEDIED